MGSQKVIHSTDTENQRKFMQYVMRDVEALDQMIRNNQIEEGITRIGAEQELCLVDKSFRPAPLADEIIKKIGDEHFTNELAKFNMEINLDPLVLKDKCFSVLEEHLLKYLELVRHHAQPLDTNYILTGILPSIRNSDLTLDNMTPRPRYYALNDAIINLRGEPHNFRIQGTDELILKNDTVMFESCNTSFQVHYQLGLEDIANKYNWALAVSGPVLAACANSPLFLGRRLWSETRIALFKQSTDTRGNPGGIREQSSRVVFGDDWVQDIVMDIYKNDISNHRPLISTDIVEDSLDKLAKGEIPGLKALSLFNGTIYKWNRLCYGISEGKPHLRIENRYLPAGPSVKDEVANTMFWIGLMHGLSEEYKNVKDKLDFYAIKTNFIHAARVGLETKFQWLKGKQYSADDVILNELLPIAKLGLEKANVDIGDADKYLGVIEERVSTGKTGANWMVNSFNNITKDNTSDAAVVAITAAIANRQNANIEVHKWKLASIEEAGKGINRFRRIDQIMSRRLYTVKEEDHIDLVPNIMSWKKIRHLLVENDHRELVGLISLGRLGKHYSTNPANNTLVAVKDIMVKEVITIPYNTPTIEAIQLMRKHSIGSLPVVNEDNKLVGIVTERDILPIAEYLLKEVDNDH